MKHGIEQVDKMANLYHRKIIKLIFGAASSAVTKCQEGPTFETSASILLRVII